MTQANASCKSFIKTLKREEIYANQYDKLEQLQANIEEFTSAVTGPTPSLIGRSSRFVFCFRTILAGISAASPIHSSCPSSAKQNV